MNCLEFHRQKLADPRRLSAAAQSHARACPDCLAFAQSIDETDARIEHALLVAVPDGLADRVLLRNSGASRPAWQAWAFAASIVLAVALGAGYFRDLPRNESKNTRPDQYALLAIEHVAGEPGSFTMLYNTEPSVFREAIRSVGAEVKAPIGRIRYVKLCPWGESTGWHIVFETPHGLATLILVPGAHISAPATASENGWSAHVQPADRGYYAVVTGSEKTTLLINRLLTERIRWKT